MTVQRFPIWSSAPDQQIQTFTVDGSAVGATQGTAGLDTRGTFVCTIAKAANVYTLNFLQGFAAIPKIIFTPLTVNSAINITTLTTTQLVFESVTRDDNTTGINDIDFQITMINDNSNKAYS